MSRFETKLPVDYVVALLTNLPNNFRGYWFTAEELVSILHAGGAKSVLVSEIHQKVARTMVLSHFYKCRQFAQKRYY